MVLDPEAKGEPATWVRVARSMTATKPPVVGPCGIPTNIRLLAVSSASESASPPPMATGEPVTSAKVFASKTLRAPVLDSAT